MAFGLLLAASPRRFTWGHDLRGRLRIRLPFLSGLVSPLARGANRPPRIPFSYRPPLRDLRSLSWALPVFSSRRARTFLPPRPQEGLSLLPTPCGLFAPCDVVGRARFLPMLFKGAGRGRPPPKCEKPLDGAGKRGYFWHEMLELTPARLEFFLYSLSSSPARMPFAATAGPRHGWLFPLFVVAHFASLLVSLVTSNVFPLFPYSPPSPSCGPPSRGRRTARPRGGNRCGPGGGVLGAAAIRLSSPRCLPHRPAGGLA